MRKYFFSFLLILLFLTACGPTTVETPFGPMVTYRNTQKTLAFDFPVDWKEGAGVDERCEDMPICYVSSDGLIMTVREANLGDVGTAQGLPLNEYMDVILVDFGSFTIGFELQKRTQIITASGLRAEVLEYTVQDGVMAVEELWYVHEGFGLTISLAAPTEAFSSFDPLVEYILESLRIIGN